LNQYLDELTKITQLLGAIGSQYYRGCQILLILFSFFVIFHTRGRLSVDAKRKRIKDMEFESLAAEYNGLAQSYKLQVTTKDIVNKASTNSLLSEDDFDKNIDSLMQSSAYHTLLKNVKVLASGWL
jgi:hypothetical protein